MTRTVPVVVDLPLFSVSLPAALWQIRHGQVDKHASTMRSLYLGGLVIAGAFTLLPGRLLGNLLWKQCGAC